MGKIKDIQGTKEKLRLGEIKASEVWSYDSQKGLKGNTVRAFEKDLARICRFEISKVGKEKIYNIKEIFEQVAERIEHANAIALRGNSNKKGVIGFNNMSNSKFIASVILNKIEYFECRGDNKYKTISQHMQSFGLYSHEFDEINSIIMSASLSAIDKLDKFGYLNVSIKYCKMAEGKLHTIDVSEYEKIKAKEKEEFKKLVSAEEHKKYKCVYVYKKYSKSLSKEITLQKIKECCGVDYVYRMYLLRPGVDIELFDDRYLDIISEINDSLHQCYEEVNTQENIQKFVCMLEENHREKLRNKINKENEDEIIVPNFKIGFGT